ncbi:hypothetical protein DIPPA_24288 [Diplonema papillatum]|nr:hypothetical protein DIPPA_24288 [Diplonema papillatum]
MLTDDQDTVLGESDHYTDIGSVASQPKVRELFLANGARFTNYFVNTPICCQAAPRFSPGGTSRTCGAKGDERMTTHAALKKRGPFRPLPLEWVLQTRPKPHWRKCPG